MGRLWYLRILRDEDTGNGDGSGDPPAPPAPQFTQADLDRIVGERLGKTRAEMARLSSEHAAAQEALAARETELGTIREETELKGKSELERLQHQIEKLTQGSRKTEQEWAQKVSAAEKQAASAAEKHVSYLKRSQISTALVGAEVVPAALDDALGSFLATADIDTDEDGKIVRVLVGGKPFASTIDAAKHFLAEKPHFAKAAPGGAGGKRRVGIPGDNGESEAFSPAQLISMGRASRAPG